MSILFHACTYVLIHLTQKFNKNSTNVNLSAMFLTEDYNHMTYAFIYIVLKPNTIYIDIYIYFKERCDKSLEVSSAHTSARVFCPHAVTFSRGFVMHTHLPLIQ